MSHFLVYVIIENAQCATTANHLAEVEEKARAFKHKVRKQIAANELDMSEAEAMAAIDKVAAGAAEWNAVHDEVGRLLAPYDANLAVPEYDEQCSCVGREARRAAEAAADLEHGTRREMVRRFDDSPEGREIERRLQEAKGDHDELGRILGDRQSLIAPIYDRRLVTCRQAFTVHPEKDSADPDCVQCKGSGKVTTTCNPKRQWDWWRVGGRFDGVLVEQEVEMDQIAFGAQHESSELNSLSGDKLTDTVPVPYAVVTPDGQWHEAYRQDYANTSEERAAWQAQARKLLNAHRDARYTIVAVDCHM